MQTKLTPKQTEFVSGIKDKNFLAFIGGNKSGKTWCGAWLLTSLMTDSCPYRRLNPPRGKIAWVVGLTVNVNETVLKPLIKNFLRGYRVRENKKDNYLFIEDFNNMIVFKSAEMGVEKFQSADVDVVWVDEEFEDENIFLELRPRLLIRKGLLFFTYTPLISRWKGKSWTREKILNNPDFHVVRASTYDNIYADKTEIEKMESDFVDENERRVRLYGDYVSINSLSVFNPKALEKQSKYITFPIMTGDYIQNRIITNVREETTAPIRIYKQYSNEKKYLMSADFSGGQADLMAITIWEYNKDENGITLEQVFVLNKLLTLDDQKQALLTIAREYHYPFLIFENNQLFDVEKIIKTQYHGQVFYDEFKVEGSRRMGFFTSQKTKYLAVAITNEILKENHQDKIRIIIHDKQTYEQLCDYIQDKNGKYKGHYLNDDIVMSVMLACVAISTKQVQYYFESKKQQIDYNYNINKNKALKQFEKFLLK